jgi:hypothetical protein
LTFLTHFFILSAILSALDSSKIASAISKNWGLEGQFFCCSGGTTRCQITKTPLHGFEPMELNLLRSEFELKIQDIGITGWGQKNHRWYLYTIYILFIYYLYNLYDLIFAIWSFILLTEAKAPLHLRILPSILCWP